MHFRQFWKKNETNFTILREHLCMLHYSSMLIVIEYSSLVKNKKANMYVVYVPYLSCSIFYKCTFLCIFNPYMDVKLGIGMQQMYFKDNPLWWCYVSSSISRVKTYMNKHFLTFMQMLFRNFLISLWKQSKAQRPFFVHFFGARQWLWWGSSAYLINTYISRRKIQQCHVALRNHVALENVQSGRVLKLHQMTCGCSFHSPLTSLISKFH